MKSDKDKWTMWLIMSIAIGVVSFLCLASVVPFFWWAVDQPLNSTNWGYALSYFDKIGSPGFILDQHNAIWKQSWMAGFITFFSSALIAMFIAAIIFAACPYESFEMPYGHVKWAEDADIHKMEKRKQIGIDGGYVGVLGKWNNGQYIKLIETISVACSAPPGTGKCLHPDEPVLMYDGTTKRTGNLQIGDLLMGPDSKPRTVLVTTPGWGPLYRVKPNKGRSFICNADHILSLRCSKAPRNKSVTPVRGDVRFATVEEWIGWSTEQKSKWKQWRAAVDFPAAENLPIDPYFLGVLIGDGTTKDRISVQTADPEIVALVYAEAEKHGLDIYKDIQKNNASTGYRLTAGNRVGHGRERNPITTIINNLGMNVTGADKFIPHIYKTASRADRLSILAGLIDADGFYDPKGKGYDIVSKSQILANDIAFVARSLGLAAYPKPCRKTCTNTGAAGEYWRVFISGNIHQIPVKLFRRLPDPRLINKDVTNVGFEIEPIGEGPYFGIIIDGDHQYLLDDFTVTHNTAAVVVPSIILSDNVSMIVNDPKPELAQMTSGYRAEIGHVFILDWSTTDKPAEGIFYPRFNFFSRNIVPPAGSAERDTFVDAVAKVVIPESKGGNDKYFVDKGRDALTGFIHYLLSKVYGENPNYEGIPDQWKGKEVSFPMLIDWFATAQYEADLVSQKLKKEAQKNKEFSEADGMKIFLAALLEEIKTNNYSNRAFTSLMPLVNMADKERSGVMGTLDQAMLPFKNLAVMERTSGSDFEPSDLRGIKCPVTGDWLPVTLYICINQAEAAAFSSVTTLLYEVLTKEFLSYGPGETNKRGQVMGDKTIVFMMDEFAKLEKAESVLSGPDLGRSKKVSYWLVFQSRSQLIKKYSKEDAAIIDSTCGVSIVLSQNDSETAKHYVNTVGKTTIRKASESRQMGLSKQANPFSRNESVSMEGVDFLRNEDVMGMEPGTHLVLPQNFMNRPMKVKSPFFYEDPEMLKKVFNTRTGLGPKQAPPMPEHIRQKRIKEWMAEREAFEQNALATQQKGLGKIVEEE